MNIHSLGLSTVHVLMTYSYFERRQWLCDLQYDATRCYIDERKKGRRMNRKINSIFQ